MRRLILIGSMIILVVALFVMWSYRFRRVADLPTWNLEDIQSMGAMIKGADWLESNGQPVLRLRVKPGDSPLAIRLPIPGIPAVEGLRVRFRLSSDGLVPGEQRWQDGRIMIEWWDAAQGKEAELSPLGSIRNDKRGEIENLVILVDQNPATPLLRLEHLGQSGSFELSELEITAVEETTLWRTGRWLLASAWLAWAALLVRSWPGIPWWRAICAAAIWTMMGIHFVIPGPWKIQRGLVSEFQMGPSPDKGAYSRAEGTQGTPFVESGVVPALGKMPDQGSFVLRVKHAITRARPLLHVLLLLIPTLSFALLLGWRPALLLSVILAASIEIAQVAFGYGFGWDDVFDLITDGLGIGLGLWLPTCLGCRRLMGRQGLAHIDMGIQP